MRLAGNMQAAVDHICANTTQTHQKGGTYNVLFLKQGRLHNTDQASIYTVGTGGRKLKYETGNHAACLLVGGMGGVADKGRLDRPKSGIDLFTCAR